MTKLTATHMGMPIDPAQNSRAVLDACKALAANWDEPLSLSEAAKSRSFAKRMDAERARKLAKIEVAAKCVKTRLLHRQSTNLDAALQALSYLSRLARQTA